MFAQMFCKTRSGFHLLGFLLLGAVLVGCGGGPEAASEKESVPDWYLNLPEDPEYVYAANTATSQKMQVAIDRATTGARGDLASNLETKIESMTKSFTEEIGDELREQYVEAQKEITSQVLQGTSPTEREVFQEEGGQWRAYVLMELPVGAAAEKFLSKVNNNDDEMYTRFRSSQAFEEMQEAVDDYEEEQKQSMSGQQDDE